MTRVNGAVALVGTEGELVHIALAALPAPVVVHVIVPALQQGPHVHHAVDSFLRGVIHGAVVVSNHGGLGVSAVFVREHGGTLLHIALNHPVQGLPARAEFRSGPYAAATLAQPDNDPLAHAPMAFFWRLFDSWPPRPFSSASTMP